MVNPNVLAARLERLQEYLHILKAVQEYDLQRFLQDPFVHGTAERNLHLAIECLLDIGNHVISDRGYSKPESYAEIFQILYENHIIPETLYGELEGMAAFRNLLVHDYLRLDRERIFAIVQSKVKCLAALAALFSDML